MTPAEAYTRLQRVRARPAAGSPYLTHRMHVCGMLRVLSTERLLSGALLFAPASMAANVVHAQHQSQRDHYRVAMKPFLSRPTCPPPPLL